jgi:hypothetical protein
MNITVRLSDTVWTGTLVVEEYMNGGHCLSLVDSNDGELIAVFTVWVEGLAANEVGIKDYSENSGALASLLTAGVVTASHRSVRSGHVIIPVCYLSPMVGSYMLDMDDEIHAEEDLIQSQQERFEANKEHYCDPEYGC